MQPADSATGIGIGFAEVWVDLTLPSPPPNRWWRCTPRTWTAGCRRAVSVDLTLPPP